MTDAELEYVAERRVLETLRDVSDATLKFWKATRHIDGFDPALEFIEAAIAWREVEKG